MTSVVNFPCIQSGMWAKNSNRKFLDWTSQCDSAGTIAQLTDNEQWEREEREFIYVVTVVKPNDLLQPGNQKR